ncbi:MAG: GNAT family N-acetyltransferase [Pseudonocardiaceae bacterium]
MSWIVRRAMRSDAAQIARINVDGWRDAYRDLVPDVALNALDVESFTARYRKMLDAATDAVTVFVAVDGDRIGAFCGVCPVRNADRDAHPKLRTGELAAIYADPPVRGSGAGHLVHDAALAHLAAGGFQHVVLWVLQANSIARTFYARHGWALDNVRDRYHAQGHAIPVVRYSRSLDGPSST